MIIRAVLFSLLICLAPLAAPAQAGEQGFVDDSGQTVRWSKPFQRIISLYPAHTENLLSLGLEEELIGVSPGVSDLPGATGKPVYSYHDDPERFLAASPDLVLVRPMIERGYPKLMERLRGWGAKVVSLQPHTMAELFDYWRKLGKLTGRQAQAEEMVRSFQAGVERLERRVAGIPPEKRPRVFFESIHSRMKTFAPDSMSVFALTAAGGVNLASDASPVRGTNIAEYGKERILSRAHEMDVYLAQRGTMNKVEAGDIAGESGFAAIKAVAQGRVHLIDEDLVSRPTPRLLLGIARLQALLHPGLEQAR